MKLVTLLFFVWLATSGEALPLTEVTSLETRPCDDVCPSPACDASFDSSKEECKKCAECHAKFDGDLSNSIQTAQKEAEKKATAPHVPEILVVPSLPPLPPATPTEEEKLKDTKDLVDEARGQLKGECEKVPIPAERDCMAEWMKCAFKFPFNMRACSDAKRPCFKLNQQIKAWKADSSLIPCKKTLVTTKPVMGSLANCKLSLNHCIGAGQSTHACFHDYRDCLTRGKHKQDKTLVTTKPVMGSLAKPGTVSIVPLPKVEVEEIEVEPEDNQEDEAEKEENEETDDEGWEYVDPKHLVESQND